MSEDQSTQPGINYELLVEDALRSVVRGALSIAQHTGLPGEAHYYISFLTDYPGVEMDTQLKEANPQEMTIVLQHQFWDLVVESDHFQVTLSFGGRHSTLVVPYAAVSHFTDPSVGFGLQFSVEDPNAPAEDEAQEDEATLTALSLSGDQGSETGSDTGAKTGPAADTASAEESETEAEIVQLDAFRRKPAPSAK